MRGKERAQQFVHQFHRAAQQDMVLPRPLAHPSQQMVVLLHQGPQQRPVIGRQARESNHERHIFRLAAFPGGGAAALLATRRALWMAAAWA